VAQTLAGSTIAADVERRLWHRAAGTLGQNEELAQELQDFAIMAIARSSAASAVRLLEKAAWLSASPVSKARRLLAAVENVQAAGLINEAEGLLKEARQASDDPELHAQAQHLAHRIDMWRGTPMQARDSLMNLAAMVSGSMPRDAARMYGHAALTSLSLGDVGLATTAIAAADEMRGRYGEPLLAVEAAGALLDLVVGRPERGRQRLRSCEAPISDIDPLSTEQLPLIVALCRFVDDDVAAALRLIEQTVRDVRAASAVGLLPFLLTQLSGIRLAADRWPSALACADESVRLAQDTGWLTELPLALVALARVEAALGRSEACRRHADTAIRAGSETGVEVVAARARSALGLLALGLGEPASAIRDLEEVRDFAAVRGLVDNALLPWGTDLLEAYVRAGDLDSARELLPVLADEEGRSGRPRLSAALDRCRGLMAPPDRAESLFAESLRKAESAGATFEQARTQLALGQLRRRRRHPSEARQPLSAALATFEQLGGQGWVEQAKTELRAIGTSVSATAPSLAALTAQETSVAQAVAEGATNQQAAARLFLSVRTVEFHLSNVYRKLGISRRSQLVRLLSDRPINEVAL
jgi:DNA-binding CsgD family transcriptional regulator